MKSSRAKVAGYDVVVTVVVRADGWGGQFQLPKATPAQAFTTLPSCKLELPNGEEAQVVVVRVDNLTAHFIGSTDVPCSLR